jgi:hypothetical protein
VGKRHRRIRARSATGKSHPAVGLGSVDLTLSQLSYAIEFGSQEDPQTAIF